MRDEKDTAVEKMLEEQSIRSEVAWEFLGEDMIHLQSHWSYEVVTVFYE